MKDSTAQLLGTAEWSVRQTRTAPASVCPITGKTIDRGKPWSLFKLFDAVDASAEVDAPEALQLAVADLNARGITDLDDAQVGVTLPEFFRNGQCVMEPGAPPVSVREIDAAIGLRRGERCHGVSLAYLHRASPTIERYLAERFGTLIYEPPAPPSPPSAEELAKQQSTERKFNAVVLAAQALTGKKFTNDEDFQRVIHLFESMKIYIES